jgi:hypothetical protein
MTNKEDRALMSGNETHMAVQTTALWKKGTPSSRFFYWPSPYAAPFMSQIGGSGPTEFSLGVDEQSPLLTMDQSLMVPWLVHTRIKQINIRAFLAINKAQAPFYLSGYSRGLREADTMATLLFAESKRSDQVSPANLPLGPWFFSASRFDINAMIELNTSYVPTVPSSPTDRLITILPGATSVSSAGAVGNMFLMGLGITEQLVDPA